MSCVHVIFGCGYELYISSEFVLLKNGVPIAWAKSEDELNSVLMEEGIL